MQIRSLAHRTDLRLLELSGSRIEDRGTHLVVRTPADPTFFWGNFLLLRQLPVPGGEREVIGAFHTEFPETAHVAIAIDGIEDQTEAVQAFAETGLEVESSVVLTASTLTEPRPVADGVVVRALEGDDDWEQRAALGDRLWSEPGDSTFGRRRHAEERALVARGIGHRFGAFVDDTLLSTAAVVATHAGVARFRSVETHPDHRRQGLASAVVHAAAAHALSAYRAETLVIVADHDSDAIRACRTLGFADTERQLTLVRRPGPGA